jgi:molybdenum cofactor guanylyltransferase/molybdopterin-guanine dinucleotide biosynthesis protein MobB
MIETSQIVGVLLAGGQSRRMGGGDKGLLRLAGKTMIGHVLDRLRPQVSRVIINANGDPARFAAFGLPVVADTVEGFVGPLAGVLSGLRWTATHAPAATHIVSVSSDAPLLPGDLVKRLANAIDRREMSIPLARSGGELHPVIGLWPVALADDLEAALRAGLRKVLHWTDRHGTVPVDFPFARIGGREVDPFFNANTPEELDELRQLLESRTQLTTPPLKAPAPVIGIVGWKKSGKTTLTVRLVEEFARRGLKVATVKHAHHDFQIDEGATDSARHRQAGAREVAIVSARRWAIVHELGEEPEPDLQEVLGWLSPADLVIVEGYKAAAIAKIEARRTAARQHTPLSDSDPHVIAIAADHAIADQRLPVFSLDDVAGIADFIEKSVGPLRRAAT